MIETKQAEGLTTESITICVDRDEDCVKVKDKLKCFLYMPECGMCPYLTE